MIRRIGRGLAALALVLAVSTRTEAAPTPLPEGAKAPDFEGKEFLHGEPCSMRSLRGQVVFFEIFRTWCGPCKKAAPHLTELHEKYGDKGLQIVGVSVDDTVDKLSPFAAEFKMNYPVLVGLDRDDLQDAYGPMWGIPTTYLISRDGKICRKHSGLVGKDRYEQDIKALL